VVIAAVAVPSAGAAAQQQPCVGSLGAAGVARVPGPALRMGITPAGEAGALGPAVAVTPIDQGRTDGALAQLAPAREHAPFVLRLNRLFWSDGAAGLDRFAALASHYTGLGYDVEIQVRYHPPPGHDGDVAGFVAFVRAAVDRFGPDPRVVGLQVTNEVNFTISPDSSDGSYRDARLALVRGVIAAKDRARERGFGQLTVGFNWFYRTDPLTENAFWSDLGRLGGDRFRAAVDWVGLDTYPGTIFPPVEAPGGERDGIVAALSDLRECEMPLAGLKPSVPIHVEENGWPTGPGRSDAMQDAALRSMVGAVDEFRGTFGVSDYRWFDLRDHNTSSLNFQHHYGLLDDAYSPKPAFSSYRDLIARLNADPPPARIALHAERRRPACALRTALIGPDAALAPRVDVSRPGGRRLVATVALHDGRVLSLARALPRCHS